MKRSVGNLMGLELELEEEDIIIGSLNVGGLEHTV